MAPRRVWNVCPACQGETRIETGEWFVDRDTGAASPITEECDLCQGTGEVEEDAVLVEIDEGVSV